MLFLDFDGVICDSLAECLVSSWLAYYTLLKKEQPALVPVHLKKEFSTLRPYVRAGEDYLLILQLLEEGKRIRNQADFDRQLAQAGTSTLLLYKKLLAEARQTLLLNDKPYWLALNPLYPHMRDPLKRLTDNSYVHLISTKAVTLIQEILHANAILFPRERIHYSGPREKSRIITTLMHEYGQDRAAFVDDQISHLNLVQTAAVDCYLATWGYIQVEWLRDLGPVKSLTPDEMVSLFSRYYQT